MAKKKKSKRAPRKPPPEVDHSDDELDGLFDDDAGGAEPPAESGSPREPRTPRPSRKKKKVGTIKKKRGRRNPTPTDRDVASSDVVSDASPGRPVANLDKRKLTKKQKGYFGARAGGAPMRKK